jgi:hypothetical protein
MRQYGLLQPAHLTGTVSPRFAHTKEHRKQRHAGIVVEVGSLGGVLDFIRFGSFKP